MAEHPEIGFELAAAAGSKKRPAEAMFPADYDPDDDVPAV
jgi:hypothetical protein